MASSPNLPRGELPVTPDVTTAALAGQEGFASFLAGSERVRVLARPVRTGDRVVGVVLVGQSLQLLEATLRGVQRLLVVATAGAASAALLGGWWLTTRAPGPIAEVTRVARDIATTGHLEQRIAAPPTRDELSELTGTFNDMLDHLEQTVH